jgi:hypothetical protein
MLRNALPDNALPDNALPDNALPDTVRWVNWQLWRTPKRILPNSNVKLHLPTLNHQTSDNYCANFLLFLGEPKLKPSSSKTTARNFNEQLLPNFAVLPSRDFLADQTFRRRGILDTNLYSRPNTMHRKIVESFTPPIVGLPEW